MTYRFSRLQLAIVIGIATAAGGLAGGVAVAAQGHMLNAKGDLQRAYNQLQMAEADKGGHRVNAMNLVNQAIGEVNAGIAVGAQ